MKIETKFNVGDEVWFMHENIVRKESISMIHAACTQEDTAIEYIFGKVKNEIWIKENKTFATKEELIKSL